MTRVHAWGQQIKFLNFCLENLVWQGTEEKVKKCEFCSPEDSGGSRLMCDFSAFGAFSEQVLERTFSGSIYTAWMDEEVDAWMDEWMNG